MKRSILPLTLCSCTLVNAALVSTEEHNLNTWQDEIMTGTTSSATFNETFTGAWGTFDLDILVSSVDANTVAPAVMNLSGQGLDLEQDGRDFTFTASLSNTMLNAGYSLSSLTFTTIKFNAATGGNDSGSFLVPAGGFTWTDSNSGSHPAPMNASWINAQNRVDLVAMNGGSSLNTFQHQYEDPNGSGGSVYRINDVRATVNVDFIPEPSSTALLSLAVVGLFTRRSRR